MLDTSKLTDDRKRRLFAVACVREVWHLLKDEQSKYAVELAELFVNGLVSEDQFQKTCNAAKNPEWLDPKSAAMYAMWDAARVAAYDASKSATSPAARGVIRENVSSAATQKQQLFLNDIVDKPDIQISPTSLVWNNQTLTKLATEIYNTKNFDNMVILADALQDANAPVEFVDHCYNPVHIKGCWLLDVLRQN